MDGHSLIGNYEFQPCPPKQVPTERQDAPAYTSGGLDWKGEENVLDPKQLRAWKDDELAAFSPDLILMLR